MTLDRRLHDSPSSATLVDLLDRVLDKGLVVAGDVSISLANVELLTIRIRLLVCSIDKAEQIGLNWWRTDSQLSGGDGRTNDEVKRLQARIAELEKQLKDQRGTSHGGR
jgi:gas vesicle protein GvpA/GvpJ/GvpM family